MKKSILFAAILIGTGCATTSPEQALLENGGLKLTPNELSEIFSGASESYTAKDVPGLTAETTWATDGRFSADWKIGSNRGTTQGKWYIENDMRCMKHDAPLPDGSDSECQTLYKTGDYYTSLNPDGSLHGIHRIKATN